MNKVDFSLRQSGLFACLVVSKNQNSLAQTMFMSPASVSRTLADLEKKLDARLFDRNQVVSILTPIGKMFLEHAQRIFQCHLSLFQTDLTITIKEKPLVHKALHIGLPQIKAFIAVSEAGSFCAAAQSINIPQSVLSRAVKKFRTCSR